MSDIVRDRPCVRPQAPEPPSGGPVIVVRGLVKRYDDLTAVDGVDLDVASGCCVGLLGPNGAGKTTTIECLEGLLRPDAGDVRILGLTWKESSRAIRRGIGVQLQATSLPDKLTVIETLQLFRSFYPSGREPEEVMDLVGLTEKRKSRLHKLSGGQRQRLTLGCALINQPRILFLDEPTTGLDPQARRRVWEIITEFKRTGGSVLLTTHYMDEAELLSDHLVIIDHGKTIAQGSPRAVIDSLGAENIIEFSVKRPGSGDASVAPGSAGDAPIADTDGAGNDDAPNAEPTIDPGPPFDLDELTALPGVLTARYNAGVTTLSVRETHRCLPPLLDHLRRNAIDLSDLRTHRPTLEDVFVSLTGRHLRDA